MAVVYLGIGSNLGDREANCLRAVALLKDRGIAVKKVSAMYKTAPWGLQNQPAFINMAVEAETEYTPEHMLATVKGIENELQRTDTGKWGPRTIDIDILLYDDVVMTTKILTIPHQLLHKRDFVLTPLAEIAFEKRHPVLNKTIGKLKEELRDGKNTHC